MERIFNQLYTVFKALMISGQMLFEWLVTPFENDIIADAIGVTTPLELMFGVSLTLVLTMWLAKFIVR